ncbi:hypothetical protein EJ04DRAFT_262523 [Polyplosphaeria fusca]|uniref:Uncharacterized protein n=1 Tax=Polyplosphaeria fusca TaxID=682080 RepID=A0A9P4RAN3_9PLEO|nr:hypothetical protein EJ04DRAFT_262523 [Polyplosphaeria fusca]
MEPRHSLEKRILFLQKAAQKLVLTSPSISASLGAERDKLLATQDADLEASKKDWDALRREVCGACGSLMLPGWSCAVSRESYASKSNKRIQKATLKPSSGRTKFAVYTCLRCNRNTSQPLPPRPPTRPKRLSGGTATQPDTVSTGGRDEDVVPKSVNASSKQRAKARKGGLQAMLAKSRRQGRTSPGAGLDLMDFMK